MDENLIPIYDVGDEGEVQQPAVTPVASIPSTELTGGEAEFARNNPNLYGFLGAVSSVVPFAEFAFPSYRKEFKNESLLKQAALLAIDAAAFLPMEWIGKGLKVLTKGAVKLPLYPIKKGLKALNIAERDVAEVSPDVISGLMRKLDQHVYQSPVTGLMKKYGLEEGEAKAIAAGEKEVWYNAGRSGGMIKGTTENMQKLIKKNGEFTKEVTDDLEYWSLSPEKQRLAFQKQEWKRYFGKLVGESDYTPEQLFKGQVRKLFGEDAAKEISLGSINGEDFQKVLEHSLLNEGKILRHVDINQSSYWFPVRKIAGAWEKAYGTLSKLYEPMKAGFSDMRRQVLHDLNKFRLIQASKGIAKFGKNGIFKEAYKGAEWREAGKMVRLLDNLQSSGKPQEVINKAFKGASETVQKIVKSYQEWADYMYAEDVKFSIQQAFMKLNPTPEGLDAFDTLMSPYGRKMNSYITEIFSPSNNLAYDQKVKALTTVLDKIKKEVLQNSHWVQKPDKDLYYNFAREMSIDRSSTGKGIANYLNNYGARIYEPGHGRYARKVSKTPAGNVIPGYQKGRTVEGAVEATEDLRKIIGTRLRQQARKMTVNPLRPAWKEKIGSLPPNLRDFFNHYLARLLGEASPVDSKVANWINAAFGTSWTGQRVKDLAYTINDMVYLGGIGFKPFSALRNLIQPILMVPGDMGGIKDTVWLVKGYQRGFSGQAMKYLQDIGAITEYAPDLLFQPQVTKFGKTIKLGGKEFTPISMRKARDLGMWMFKLSDRVNRYVTGGAAMSKWEHYAKKIFQEEGGLRLTEENISKFLKKINLTSREPWIRDQISTHLRSFTREGLEEAKKVYVKDVVADTQFLYGVADSPLITQKWGSVGKNALVFQSWWMNYGAELQKWLVRSGSVDEAAQRMFAWMASSAILGNILIPPIWGKQTARRTVLAGPLPLSIDVPAPWRPIRDGFNTIISAGEASIGLSDLSEVKNRMIATLKSSMIYVPGGIQATNLIRGASKEGFPGFMKEIVRYRPQK